MKEQEPQIKFSEDEPKFDLECLTHGVIVKGITDGEVRLYEYLHRENLGCYFDIKKIPSLFHLD